MEKLVKSVNNIKLYYAGENEDASKDTLPLSTKNERQECCKAMAESILSSAVKSNNDYPALLGVTLETLLLCCQDSEADVRIAAEESINRVIKGTEELHFGKVLVEFYKEIKRNSSSRSLRAALSRFANLAHRIRPTKCRPYIVSLIPVFIRICSREDESVQECLSSSIAKIFPLIGSFASESEVKDLVSALMKNLSHTSAAIRRNSASCIFEIISNSNKKRAILSTSISDLLGLFQDLHLTKNFVLGALTTIRYLVPLFASDDPALGRRTGSFGSETGSKIDLSFDGLVVSILELCSHMICANDQSIVTASLETLQAVLRLPCHLMTKLLAPQPFEKSRLSQALGHEVLERLGLVPSISEKSLGELSATSSGVDLSTPHSDGAAADFEKIEVTEKLEAVSISSEGDSKSPDMSNEHKSDTNEVKPLAKETDSLVLDDGYCNHSEDLYTENFPLDIIARLLCERILQICEEKSKNVRVSAKSLALSCLGMILKIRPKVLFMKVSSKSELEVCETLSYKTFYDPQIRGCVSVLIAQYLESALLISHGEYNDWVECEATELSVDALVEVICRSMLDESTVCVRASIQSACICVRTLLWTKYAHLGVKLLEQMLKLKNTSYWLVKADILDAFGELNFRQIIFPQETAHDVNKSRKFALLSKLCDEIMNVAFKSLGDKDGRVRKAAAAMLVKYVSNGGLAINSFKCDMASSQVAVLHGNASEMSSRSVDWNQKGSGKSLLKTYRGFEKLDDASHINHNLSAVVGKLSELMSLTISKHLTQGCIQALLMLSAEFCISKHPSAYDCQFYSDSNTPSKKQLIGLVPILLPMIDSAWPPLDLVAHANALLVTGNYVAGIASHGFRIAGANPKMTDQETLLPAKGSTSPDNPNALSAVLDSKIGALFLRYFSHILKLLSMLHHIISETTPSMPNKSVLQTLQTAPSLPNTLKKKEKSDSKETGSASDSKTHKKTPSSGKVTPGSEDGDKEKSSKLSSNSLFSFAHSRVYMKIHEMLGGAYESYKTTSDSDEVDKFSFFLRTVLDALSQILELVVFDDIERYTEDILSFLKTIFTVEPTMTVQAVQQLLKGLFGTNFVAQLDLEDQNNTKPPAALSQDQQNYKASFYHQVFHRPLNDFTMAIANSSIHHYLQQENAQKASTGWFGSIKKKVEKKLTMTAKRSKGDKMSIQNYIRLFESLVIKSLKNYTMTSSAEFQKHVLNLLAQLVQLRVNYCLLDSDQIFIGFIIKQFESIESGLVHNSTILIPHVFFFLVLLSYEKYHSKSVIAMPKIMQLCDGVMASGCDTSTHVIPALEPIIHDLFVLRASQRQDATSDLDTQREVAQSILFRIIEYPKVLAMVMTILHYYRKENPEQWKRYSRQVTDVLLPLLSHLKLRVHTHPDALVLHNLFEALSPTALRPIDLVLNIFFMTPSDLRALSSHQRWIVKTNALLRVLLCNLKEDYLLQRVQEMAVDADLFSIQVLTSAKYGGELDGAGNLRGAEAAPLAEDVFSKVLYQIIGFTIHRIVAEAHDPVKFFNQEKEFELLNLLLSELLLSVTYISRCGNFKRITKAFHSLLSSPQQEMPPGFYSPASLCSSFHLASLKYPIVTLQWSQFLTCVGHMDLTEWGKLTGKNNRNDSMMPILSTGMVSRGAVIMLADYVCQNQSEVEAMSWLIVNHMREVLTLQNEPPIQDFISAIHRNSFASRLFVESIMTLLSGGERIKASLKHRLLHFISGLHLKQSAFIVKLLLSEDWFVFSPILAISQFSDRLACTRLEMLLVQASENKDTAENDDLLASLCDIEQDVNRCKQEPRLGRLIGLAMRLRFLLENGHDDPKSSRDNVATENTDPENGPSKEWFKGLVDEFCQKNYQGHDVAAVLSILDYDDIMEVFQKENFKIENVDECLRFAIDEITRPDDAISRDAKDVTSTMLQASLTTLAAHLKSFIDQFPDLDVNFIANPETVTFDLDGDNVISKYWKTVFSVFDTSLNRKLVLVLAKSFTRCLMWRKVLNHPFNNLDSLEMGILKLAVSCHQYLIWCVINSKNIDTESLLTCFELFHQIIAANKVEKSFFKLENVFDATVITNSVYVLHQRFSEEVGASSNENVTASLTSILKSKSSPFYVVLKACKLLDQLISGSAVIPVIIKPLKKSLQLVLSHPFFNKLARVPSLLFKGDVTVAEAKAILDEPLANYLPDKDVLQEYIARINAVGWTSRMQFEETWTTLLGVLVSQPIGDVSQNATPVDETAIQVSCLTISALTSLVVFASMKPHGGRPPRGAYQNIPRGNSSHLPDNKIGHDLKVIQRTISNELDKIIMADCLDEVYDRFQVFSHCMLVTGSSLMPVDWLKSRLSLNLERQELSPLHYGIGQRSVHSFRLLHGILPHEEEPTDYPSEDEADHTQIDSSSDETNSESNPLSNHEMTVVSGTTPTPTGSDHLHEEVDTHSCVQFLIDLFSEWFRSASAISPTSQQSGNTIVSLKLPRQFLCDCLHSLILISDFFTDRQQFEWMFSSLNSLQLVQPSEDDVMLQYLVLGMCKAAAVLGLTKRSCDILYGMLEAAFGSTLVSCQTLALYGALYLMETKIEDFTKPIVHLISKFVLEKLKSANYPNLQSQQLLWNVMSIGCLLIEKAQIHLPAAHTKSFIQCVINLLSSSSISNNFYVLLTRSLESLIASYSLSAVDCDAIAKLASNQFITRTSPVHALTSLHLMITCMYYHVLRMSETNSNEDEAMESRLVAMERVTILFDKIKNGFLCKSRILVRIMPLLLDSFFSTQDMMNKVIGEFASGLHPYPELIAEIMYRVFQILHARGEGVIVSEWVMLSLRNFIQRTPISKAVWYLTCIFTSASTNHWVNSTMPMVLQEAYKSPHDMNYNYFYIASQDFYVKQLLTELDRRAFISGFKSVAEPGNHYQRVLDVVSNLDFGET